jgi:hypothetical protein
MTLPMKIHTGKPCWILNIRTEGKGRRFLASEEKAYCSSSDTRLRGSSELDITEPGQVLE